MAKLKWKHEVSAALFSESQQSAKSFTS